MMHMQGRIGRRAFLKTVGLGGGATLASLEVRALLAEGPVHVVRRGDTLTNIGRRYGITVRDLKLWNGLNSDLILIDQKLFLKPVYRHLPLQKITRPK
ncbi:MAG TPA: LysM peptidoglycan-binding domain-containing protein, partial [Myxococcales bacterium]|nr:LysM peptidoglycan-binding domain-containing protein [Myxococcales bacterium]